MEIDFDRAQKKAAHTIWGPLMVIACPGSGKTTTMLRRIDCMIRERRIDPKNILMITFTRAAANEMKDRFNRQYGCADVTFCTIHSLLLTRGRKSSLSDTIASISKQGKRSMRFQRILTRRTLFEPAF